MASSASRPIESAGNEVSRDRPPDRNSAPDVAAIADRYRVLAVWLVFASTITAILLTIALKVRINPQGSSALEWLVATLLLASRMWWNRIEHRRMADACGTIGVVALGGMSCGAIAMLELRLHFPLTDSLLQSWDHALRFDGIAMVEALLHQGHWIFWLMAPAYNFAIPIFFGSLIILAWRGDRVEAWRAALCFVGTLFTTCMIAAFLPAKGLATWASNALLAQLPDQAMRSFWAHFDAFYFGADPVLRMQVVDGVIAFPSFHAIVGFLVAAMWRKNTATFIAALVWLGIMLLGTFPGGGHYLVDLLGGFLVWAAWFAWSREMERQVAEGMRPRAQAR